jgi:hypothetical protein
MKVTSLVPESTTRESRNADVSMLMLRTPYLCTGVLWNVDILAWKSCLPQLARQVLHPCCAVYYCCSYCCLHDATLLLPLVPPISLAASPARPTLGLPHEQADYNLQYYLINSANSSSIKLPFDFASQSTDEQQDQENQHHENKVYTTSMPVNPFLGSWRLR